MPRNQNQVPAAAVIAPTSDASESYDAIQAAIERQRDKLTQALAAVHITPERFLTVVDQALRRNPELLRCTPSSVLKAMLDAAELGLVPSGLIGQAYLVPYRNRRTGRLEAQLIPGYRGLIDLVRRSGELLGIEARVVRQNDEFDVVFGTNGMVHHRPYINRDRETVEVPDRPGEFVIKDGGPYIGAYCIATLRGGQQQVEWLSYAEVEALRGRSKAAANGPWVTDWPEMAKKSVTRRTVKYLPLSIDSPVNRALALEDEAESNAAPALMRVATARDAFQAALTGAAEPEAEPEAGTDGCDAVDPDGVVCELAAAHDGPHKAFDGDELLVSWPQGDDGEAG